MSDSPAPSADSPAGAVVADAAPSADSPAVAVVADAAPAVDLAALQTANARRVRLLDLARSNPMIRDLLQDYERAQFVGEQSANDLAAARASLDSAGARVRELETDLAAWRAEAKDLLGKLRDSEKALAERDAELVETRKQLQAALAPKPAAGGAKKAAPAAAPAPAGEPPANA